MAVRRGDVVNVNGTLRYLRSQLEKLKGEVDWVLTRVDEGLKSIGLEEFSNLE